jgi:hypothetical protein
MSIIVNYLKEHRHHWIEISSPPNDNKEQIVITFMNSLGEELQQLYLTGNKHKIDISRFHEKILNVKVETLNCIVLKNIVKGENYLEAKIM